MKKIIAFLSIFSILLVSSCKKSGEQNPLADVANLSVGSYLTLKSTTNLNFSYNVPTSTVGITVDKYGEDVQKVDLFVVQGANSNPTTWKRIKTITWAGSGTAITATSQEVATALGVSLTSLSPGNYYTFYNRITTVSGKVYDLTNTQGALESNSNYNSVFRWSAFVTCPFVGPVAGNYRVLQDDWQDWNVGDIVQVTDGPGVNIVNLSQVWPNSNYGNIVNPLLVKVDPATGAATVPLVTFANGYPGTATAQGANANDGAGYVFSCTGYITLTMKVTYNGSSQGNMKLILQKI